MLLGHILNDNFLNVCVEATWEYGHNDPKFCEQLPFLNVPEDGRLFVKGFFAIKWHLGLINHKQYRWAWETDPLKHQPEIAKVMTRRQFELMLRYFRCTPQEGLPAKNANNYHPLQNIKGGVDMLRENSKSLWNVGRMLCIDEGRVTSKSKRNKFKTRMPKPIRMGYTYTVDKLADNAHSRDG